VKWTIQSWGGEGSDEVVFTSTNEADTAARISGSDFAWGFGPTCGPPFVSKNAAFVFVSQPLGTNAYWNQKQKFRYSIAKKLPKVATNKERYLQRNRA
jgi:hypothetical protein